MMKKLLLVSLLFCGSQALAAPHLIVGNNLTVLAAKSADVSIFSDKVTLKEGEQKVVVKYDSPENPSSTNQSNGRITSKPWLLTFNASGDEEITLSIKQATDTSEVRALAKAPVFSLTDNGKAVPFTPTPLVRQSAFGSISTSWDSVVNGEATPAAVAVAAVPVVAATPVTAPAPAVAANGQSSAERFKAMQQLYLQSDAAQRKAFLKWALDVQ
jgi:hypothetical protein